MWTLPSAIGPGAVASPVVLGCAFGPVWVPAVSPLAAFAVLFFLVAAGLSVVDPACSAVAPAAGFGACLLAPAAGCLAAGVDDCAKAVAPNARAPTRVPAS